FVFDLFFFSSRRRHTRSKRDWSSDVCSSDLLGALSATAQANRRIKYDPGVPGFLHVYPPYSYRSIFGDEDKEASDLKAAQLVEEMINWEGEDSVAAFIMEPFISGGGVIIPSFKYMQRIQEICEK